ncbi:MAG: excinuclease ABC subunit B [Chloroflexi bacterium]|nr:MAG: excinuclease ABC subunit B [Chloroflexota bacterium]PIE81920.1 MAG: excinuclease ABC subunit B [Chloroflexota bacterium]
MPKFELVSDFQPTGDQPDAIAELVNGLNSGDRFQTLLGATGTGKTFTIANIIQETQKPTLILAHNKTLAAQLYSEFREFFPNNAVSYFVSYYDYYQPEAYVPRHDLFIEKETQINDEIDRLRLLATANLLSREDVIIVASVSCIYGIGNPQAWGKVTIEVERGKPYRRDALLRRLVDIQYDRNDLELRRGTFRVRGDTLQIFPAYAETAYTVEFWGDEVERLTEFETLTGEVLRDLTNIKIFPARQFITDEDKLAQAINDIETELTNRIAYFKERHMLLEAQRIEQRVMYDLEMLREVGFTSGIENYSRHMDQREEGAPPWTLLDYFPPNYLVVVDESHMTLPQVRGMFAGDRSRKQTLVDYGFRLPSALDNRPLNFDEFGERINQAIFTSATPGSFEFEHSTKVTHQVIRPTGILDPEVEVRPVKGQVDDLVWEIKGRTEKGQRVLVTTLTKRMAEDLSDYLLEMGIKVHYLHSEVHTIERTEILRDLRMGVFDVVVGINLLREGLDLPEVSLVAILDADKEGFLRSETSLTQTIGRAARHVEGKVIMYADKVTDSMKKALKTTNDRRAVQQAYNEEHGIEPQSIMKAVRDLTDDIVEEREMALAEGKGSYITTHDLPKAELAKLVMDLEKQMKQAAQQLEFEKAALLRDRIVELRQIMTLKEAGADTDMPEWERMRKLDEAGIAYDPGD